MDPTRRAILTAGGAALGAAAVAPRAFAQWRMNDRYPDPAVEHPRSELRASIGWGLPASSGIATGTRWNEGPVWFGDGRYLLWSDIPNNRIMRWQEETGAVSVFRQPSNNANGNTRDRQGRLVTCEHDTRRVTRTEYDGTITVLIDKFDGKPLNSPNDVVVKSDDSIWFTDPPFGILGNYEGHVATPELPTNVYRLDPKTGRATVAAGDVNRPNGLAFSPDEIEALRRRGRRHPARHQGVRRHRQRHQARQRPRLPHRRARRHARRLPPRRRRQPVVRLGHGQREAGRRQGLRSRRASRSASSRCPSAAPTSASAASSATACSWRRATRSIRSMSTRRA